MGYYNVVQPCMVGKFHYTRPTAAPIKVDDETAAPLVESGCLEPYRPGVAPDQPSPDLRTDTEREADEQAAAARAELGLIKSTAEATSFAQAVDAAVATESPRRPRGRTRKS